jgi:hypothetical protein
MTYLKFPSLLLAFLAGSLMFFSSCKKDEDNDGSKGQLNLEITDGPADDPNVKAVFVTVAEIKVDGQTFSGFSGKKTIDLMAYQEGNVAALGLGQLEAGSYQNITLVLDTQTDANGNSPGCYVQTFDNVKHGLSSNASIAITSAKNFVIASGAQTNLVLDFDLRKAIQYQSGGTSDQYDFVATADLQTAVRVVLKSEAAKVTGTCQNSIINTDKIVAFVYKKGSFNRLIEMQSSNGVSFKNAVASTEVNSNGSFTVAFLDPGEYEIHFAAFKDLDSDDKLELQGTLILTSLINLESLQLGTSASLELNISVIGILP